MTTVDLTGLKLLAAFEGDITAEGTETGLTTYGAGGATGTVKVKGTIQCIIVQAATDSGATGGAHHIARIRGGGGKPIDLLAGGENGGTVADGGACKMDPLVYYVSIPWDGVMSVYGEMVGADSGTVNMSVHVYGT